MLKRAFLPRNLNITVTKIVTGPFQENSFIVSLDNRNEAILIDPGDDHQLIINQVDKKNLKPIVILNTHARLDHIGAVSQLRDTYKIPFYLHKEESIILDSYEASCELFGLPIKQKPKVDVWLEDENNLSFGDFSVNLIKTPLPSSGFGIL